MPAPLRSMTIGILHPQQRLSTGEAQIETHPRRLITSALAAVEMGCAVIVNVALIPDHRAAHPIVAHDVRRILCSRVASAGVITMRILFGITPFCVSRACASSQGIIARELAPPGGANPTAPSPSAACT